jgi:tripartite-type tricarboxylate transporter receptor subunit TctC
MAISVCLIILCMPLGGFAQEDFPNKPIEIIVPWPAGAPGDLASRILGDKWSEFLGQPLVVINKPGASGALGSKSVAQAKPDGYKLLSTGDSQLLTARLGRKEDPGYDLESFRLLFNFSKFVLFLSVKSDARWKTLKDFLAEAKNLPGKLKYSTMVGSSPHLAAEMFANVAGVKLTAVPFKSSPECLTAAVGGNVDMAITFGLGGMGKSGLIRTLATSDESRLPDYPDVPTLKELGHAIPYSTTDLGIGAPAKTPERVISKLVEAYEKTHAKYGAYLKDRLLRIEQYSIHMDGRRAAENYREKERLFKEFYTQIGFKIE